MKREGFDATFELVKVPSRHAAEVIANVARDTEADLVIVGSHGYSAVGDLILGSVTQQLLHLKSCPVLAIPPKQQTARNEAPELAGAEAVR